MQMQRNANTAEAVNGSLVNCLAPVESLKKAFSCFPSGVTALCGIIDGVPVGMAVSSFATVSLAPPLLSVCIQSESSTWERLRRCPAIGVSVLSEEQDSICRQLSSRNTDRFAGVRWTATSEGAVFIDKTAASFDCTIFNAFQAGDHSLVLLEIRGLTSDRSVRPLVFHAGQLTRLPLRP